jgi:uncharacterized protein YndB with AHSA1/START domain
LGLVIRNTECARQDSSTIDDCGFSNCPPKKWLEVSEPAGVLRLLYTERLNFPTRRNLMTSQKITVETVVAAPVDQVWRAYTTPADIKQWNAASDDWHTTDAKVDLRVGGLFSSRMEAKDGSFGFDFAGTYTEIVEHKLLAYSFGDRFAKVEFSGVDRGTQVRVTFDSEPTHSMEQQQTGWQAILDNFTRHVEGKRH